KAVLDGHEQERLGSTANAGTSRTRWQSGHFGWLRLRRFGRRRSWSAAVFLFQPLQEALPGRAPGLSVLLADHDDVGVQAVHALVSMRPRRHVLRIRHLPFSPNRLA